VREVQVWVRCDRCREKYDMEAILPKSEAEREVIEGFPLTFGRDEVALDLCRPCIEILENEFATLIAAGRRLSPVPKAKAKKKAVTDTTTGRRCPECEAEGVNRVIETPQGFAVHRFRAHGVPGETKPRNHRKAKT
jgi:ribosomal protein L37AE/L43A